nr:hypothetical protein [Tanacetum cinerariifolium]
MANNLPKLIWLIITVVSYTLMMFGLTKDVVHLMLLEDTIRQALRLDDADGIDCLPNEEIFAELARIRYEKPGLPGMNLVLSWPRLSSALPQKVFANMRRNEEDEDDNELFATSTPPSPTSATTPPLPQQEHVPSPPQAQPSQPSSLPHHKPAQPAASSKSLMTLLNTLMETFFDDEEVTMSMAQTLIKIKAEKARILDKQMAKRLQDEEIE